MQPGRAITFLLVPRLTRAWWLNQATARRHTSKIRYVNYTAAQNCCSRPSALKQLYERVPYKANPGDGGEQCNC